MKIGSDLVGKIDKKCSYKETAQTEVEPRNKISHDSC